nr:hypothetical protein [Tanacetum cinerariifolium]
MSGCTSIQQRKTFMKKKGSFLLYLFENGIYALLGRRGGVGSACYNYGECGHYARDYPTSNSRRSGGSGCYTYGTDLGRDNKKIAEDNAQLRSRFKRDMQVQLQREVERLV